MEFFFLLFQFYYNIYYNIFLKVSWDLASLLTHDEILFNKQGTMKIEEKLIDLAVNESFSRHVTLNNAWEYRRE